MTLQKKLRGIQRDIHSSVRRLQVFGSHFFSYFSLFESCVCVARPRRRVALDAAVCKSKRIAITRIILEGPIMNAMPSVLIT